MENWNSHYIRRSEYSCVHGRPELLYQVFNNEGLEIDSTDIDQVQDVVDDHLVGIDNDDIDVNEYFVYLCTELGLSKAETFTEAKQNFLRITEAISDFELF